MAQAFDVKRALRELYLPPTRPTIVDVPAMTFVMVDGAGNPNDEEGAYARAIQALYSLTYTIKMSPRAGRAPEGFFEFACRRWRGCGPSHSSSSTASTCPRTR